MNGEQELDSRAGSGSEVGGMEPSQKSGWR